MKLLLMCDAQVGREIANWLLQNYAEDLGAVVTISDNDVYVGARAAGIPSFVFKSEAQLLSDLALIPRLDIGILAWWPKIISPALIESVEIGFINTHPSLLPHNRGKHPNFWALVEQRPYGVSLHFVDQGIDSGDIVAQLPIAYDWEDTGESLYLKATQATIKLFKLTYPIIRSGHIPRTPQNLSNGSLHYTQDMDAASIINLDKSYTARELLNLLRARTFTGYPACCFEEFGIKYEIRVSIRKKRT